MPFKTQKTIKEGTILFIQTSNLFLYKCDVSFRPIHPTYFQLLEEMDYYYVADSNAKGQTILKRLLVSSDSSKKRTNEFGFFA